jgi:hypothetical protein
MFHATIDNARTATTYSWFGLGGMNAICAAAFFFPLFEGKISTNTILLVVTGSAILGFLGGLHITFRSTLSSGFGLFMFSYFFIACELLMGSGGFVLLTRQAGHPEMRGLSLYVISFCMVITLFGGIRREAIALGVFSKAAPRRWQQEIEKYIDYPSREVRPALTNGQGLRPPRSPFFTSPYAILAIGTSGIPLLFELYGGGKVNAIFFASPVLSITAIYLNYKFIGPGLVRIVLLRKLEKSLGYRFINADLEQIQELRRTFFLSRWLMKDYTKPSTVATATQKPAASKSTSS